MIPLPFIEPKAGYPIYRLKLETLQHLLPGRSQGLDTICDGILGNGTFVLNDEQFSVQSSEVPVPSSGSSFEVQGSANEPARLRSS
jgi:hypothetical protein